VADATALTRSHNSHYVLIAGDGGRGLQEKGAGTFNQQGGSETGQQSAVVHRSAICGRNEKKKTCFFSFS